MTKKESDRVLADYDRVIALDAGLADAYLERGLFYKSLGQPGEAARDLQRFLALGTDPQQRRQVEQELRKLR